MESSNMIFIVLFVLVFLTAIVLYFINLNNAKSNIRNYLQKRGATNINVYQVWFDEDRDTMTFDVVYTGVKGNRKTTRCKLRHLWVAVDSEIFWSDPLSLELAQIEKEIPRSKYHELSEKIRSHLPFELPTYEISTVLPIRNSQDQIVMMKYVAAFRNILRCKPDGSLVWQAELPTTSDDVYTNVEWKDEQLTAFSRSLMVVQLDLETGKFLP